MSGIEPATSWSVVGHGDPYIMQQIIKGRINKLEWDSKSKMAQKGLTEEAWEDRIIGHLRFSEFDIGAVK